jgi:hypothetical protein
LGKGNRESPRQSPPPGRRQGQSDRQHDLADMIPGFHPGMRRRGIG